MTFRLLSTFLAVLLLAPTLRAEEEQPPITVTRITSPIVVDGDLSDAAWREAIPVETFFEFRPGDNVKPAVSSRAWFAYDDDALYVAFDFADPEPSKINAPFADHDEISGYATDFAGIMLDARADGKTATEFIATARGVKFDAVIDDATGIEDAAPDFFWEAEGRIIESGWQMEFRIPFSSLRYDNTKGGDWRVIVYRNYPRDRRYQIASNPVPRGLNCFICTARKLTGLSGLPPGGNLIIAPYVTGSADQVARAIGSLDDAEYDSEIGGDVKWTPNPDTAVDLALNPDFSQVEADATQISANERFAIYYPEKRPFFLEGVEMLSTPMQAVHTRTITSPRWGGRATGEFGANAYTVLLASDRGGGLTITPGPLGNGFEDQESSSVFIGRLRRDFTGHSFISVLANAREYEGDSYNRVLGPDFQWRPDDRRTLTGQLLFSETHPSGSSSERIDKRSGHAGYANWSYSNDRFDYLVEYTDIDHDFRADSGFMPQVGYRSGIFEGGYTIYPKDRFFHRFRRFAVARNETEIGGETIFQRLALGFGADGRRSSAWQIYASAEKVQSEGRIFDQNRLYYHVDFRPTQNIVDGCVNGWIGEDIDYTRSRPGEGATVNAGFTINQGTHFSVRLSTNWRWLDIDQGRLFTARVHRARAMWNFNARSFVRGIVEYVRDDHDPELYFEPIDRRTGGLAGSLLFAYKLNWQSVLFVGYGENQALDTEDDFGVIGRQLFVKLSYAFQK